MAQSRRGDEPVDEICGRGLADGPAADRVNLLPDHQTIYSKKSLSQLMMCSKSNFGDSKTIS
jgi:hypothetical protein